LVAGAFFAAGAFLTGAVLAAGLVAFAAFATFATFVTFAAFVVFAALVTFAACADFAGAAARLAVEADFVAFAGPLARRAEDETRALPPIETEPPGTIVDSSPVDHLTRRSLPLNPVTTPSRSGWPNFLDAT
jgi:hypothetical protein